MPDVDPPEVAPPKRGFLTRVAVAGLVIAIVLVLAIGQYFATRSDDDVAAAADVVSLRPTSTTEAPTTTITTTTTLPPTTTTTIPPLVQPAPVALPPVPGGSVHQGSRAAEIMGYEARLHELHFDPGPVDGVFDEKTRFAAEGFDKLMGWPRDGVIDQPFVDALSTFQYPAPYMPQGEADRVEINLDTQVLTLYKGWQVVLITPTSTGTGKRFCGGSDGCQYAVTPTGRFAFTWHHNGWRDGDLGRLYNPWYFNGGIAVHGYSSVPTKPASHGCARIPMYVAEYFPTLVYKDMTVYVYGTQAPQGGYGSDTVNGGSAPAAPAPPPTAPPETVPPAGTPDTTPPPTAPPATNPPDTTTTSPPPPETTTTPPPPDTTTTPPV